MQYWVEGSESTKTLYVSGSSATEVTISGLINATTYAIGVAAVNSAGIGEYSTPLTVETDSKSNSNLLRGVLYATYNYGD